MKKIIKYIGTMFEAVATVLLVFIGFVSVITLMYVIIALFGHYANLLITVLT